MQFDPDIVGYAVKTLRGLKHVEINHSRVNQEIEKIRWSFQYLDPTGAIKGDLFLPTLKAFIDKKESLCLTVFDIKNLTQINLERGWEAGNEVLKHLVRAINIQCCASYDIRDIILRLMKEDVIDITSPVVFRIGGDEFAVIAPYIPPKEKVIEVVKFMNEIDVGVDYLQLEYPLTVSTYQEAINKIFAFTKSKLIAFYI
jgi:GGDEF domain-containing protein